MSTFAVIASRATPTSARLGPVLTPAQAVARLCPGDVALGRLDVLPSLDGVEPGLWALDILERRGVTVLNGRDALATAHDKLATAEALACAGIPHPPTKHVAPWLPMPSLESPLVLKPRFGSWGRDVTLCCQRTELIRAIEGFAFRAWFRETGGVLQDLVPPIGHDLRIIVAAAGSSAPLGATPHPGSGGRTSRSGAPARPRIRPSRRAYSRAPPRTRSEPICSAWTSSRATTAPGGSSS